MLALVWLVLVWRLLPMPWCSHSASESEVFPFAQQSADAFAGEHWKDEAPEATWRRQLTRFL